MLRFKNSGSSKYHHLSVNSSPFMSQTPGGELSVNEVQVAEREIIKQLQKQSFPRVVEAPQRVTRNQVPHQVKPGLRKLKIATSLCKLNPVLDSEGLLRVGGRLENAAISYNSKHQIILIVITSQT